MALASHLIHSGHVTRPKWVPSLVHYRQRLHRVELLLSVICICTNKEIMGVIAKAWEAPFIRAWDEYPEGDFNVIVKLSTFWFICIQILKCFFSCFSNSFVSF